MNFLIARLRRLVFEGDVMRLAGLTLLVKPIGLVTQILLASYFGAGARYDAYALALFLVTFLEASIGRVYNGVVVPATIRYRAEISFRALMGYQNAVFLVFLLPAAAVMGLLVVRPEWFVDLIARDLPDETRSYVLRMVPRMAIGGMAMLMVTMGKAILQLNRRYGVAGAMPLVNGVVILVVLWLGHEQWGIWALPLGFTIANLLQLLIVGVNAFRTHCATLVRPSTPTRALLQVWNLGWMFLVTEMIMTINNSVDKFFASGLPEGNISALTYAMTIVNLGRQLFAFSLVVVMFTRISEFLASEKVRECDRYIHENIVRVTKLAIPVSLALFVASEQVVRVLFQRGEFDVAATTLTSGVLAFYVLGLPAHIVNLIMGRVYHSLQRLRDKVWLAAQFLLTNVGGNIILVKILQAKGLAISSTLALNIHLVLVFLVLSRYRTGLQVGRWAAVVARGYFIGVITWVIYTLSGLDGWFASWPAITTVSGAMAVAAGKLVFVVTVYGVLHLGLVLVERRWR